MTRRRAPDPALAVALGAREHYLDHALYDYEYRRRRDDVAWYVALAERLVPAGGAVLELGCGTGRITLALARAGFQVVAVDAEPTMLAGLRARLARAPASVAARVEVRAGDLRDFALRRRFPLVVAGFNVLEHLYTRVELAACLARVRAHLAPDGRFAFDVQLPDPGWLARDATRRWARTKFRHPVTGVPTWYSTNHDYDPVSQIAIIRIYYQPVDGGPETVVHLSQRKYFPAELEALLAHARYRLVERHGDFAGGPLGPISESQIVVCAAAGGADRRRPRRG